MESGILQANLAGLLDARRPICKRLLNKTYNAREQSEATP